jgi:tRNA(Ile)-lysidine synthase
MLTPDLDWLGGFEDEDRVLLFHVSTSWFVRKPKTIGVAVSGGGDSMALLHLAKTLQDHMEWSVQAVTVDHGLRTESAGEATQVAEICAGWNISHTTLHWKNQPRGGNLQSLARAARYDLMGEWAKANDIDCMLLGHTSDDISENFLIRLARKAGVDGLASMAEQFKSNDVDWARPLWQTNRAELRRYLQRHDVTWIDDPSNDDPRFTRVQMRQALDVLEPLGITRDALFDVSVNMASAQSALQQYAYEAAQNVVIDAAGGVTLPTKNKAPGLPEDITRRLIIAALRYVSGQSYAPRQAALFDIIHGLIEQPVTLHGCVITPVMKDGRLSALHFGREYQTIKNEACDLADIWDGRWQITGPDMANCQIKALGDGIEQCPDWRETDYSWKILRTTPAIWQGNILISAPLAGFNPEWQVHIVTQYHSYLLSH